MKFFEHPILTLSGSLMPSCHQKVTWGFLGLKIRLHRVQRIGQCIATGAPWINPKPKKRRKNPEPRGETT